MQPSIQTISLLLFYLLVVVFGCQQDLFSTGLN